MGLLPLAISHPLSFALLALLLLYSVVFHEVAHGVTAYAFGDDTAKRAGRLTLNPLMHFDPMGALMLFFVGFGWARPVPVNYFSLKRTRWGLLAVAMAGVTVNILIAMLARALLQSESVRAHSVATPVLTVLFRINMILGAFNLIPIPPLDGSKILLAFLPEEKWRAFAKFEPYGILLLLFLLVTGLLEPVIVFMQNQIQGLMAVFIR